MMRTYTTLLALAALAPPQGGPNPLAPSAPELYFEGRYLKAYDVAARNIEGQKGLPKEWRDREKYAVAFEGEKDGCYVLHFLPIREPDKGVSLGTNPKLGLPVRIYVRKKDLKFVDAFVE